MDAVLSWIPPARVVCAVLAHDRACRKARARGWSEWPAGALSMNVQPGGGSLKGHAGNACDGRNRVNRDSLAPKGARPEGKARRILLVEIRENPREREAFP
ncbi:MAG: hypothetical protein LBO79_08720 [Zoogloeaceae bacterium]|nr:hypothetical protein [Zoogloeaceae bacterium]